MILIINTSNNGIDLALDNNVLHIDSDKQSVALPTAVADFLQTHNIPWYKLTAIGVIVGPGSFTGIRLGIAYAKGLGLGLNIPVVPINAFEIYLQEYPDAIVALDSGRGDFFVAAKNLEPCIMNIDELETKQMEWPRTIGHKPFNLIMAYDIVRNKLKSKNIEPVIPMYIRPSYVEKNKKD